MADTKQAPTFKFGGMFTAFEEQVYSTYAGGITWRDRIAGGTPSDPKLIEGWLKSKMPGMTSDIERRHMLIRTLREMGGEDQLDSIEDVMSISIEQLEKAAEKVAATRGANGFKRPDRRVAEDGTVLNPGHMAIETRHLKAAIKENVSILFSETRWGPTRKGTKSFAAEHVFVNPLLDPEILGEEAYEELTYVDPDDARKRKPRYPDFLFLTRYNGTGEGPMFELISEPDEIETFIGHVSGPQGPRSNLTRVEVVTNATVHFDIKVLRDEIQHEHWPIIWLSMQENGLGAMRSQGYGRFDVSRFERTGGKFPGLDWDDLLANVDKDAVLKRYQSGLAARKARGETVEEETDGLVSLAAPVKRGRPKKAVAAE